ncbi:MAG: hypothetical protein MR009_01130 [Sutterellaceae bacterium]|nr:hypothetical protein [Sutterellaceae bacterium]MDD7442048.1 hypothetical protein [Sutterellaceae bacterium]MDY2867881.1 hypothetical protein [Mesosutterella sp.]
MEGYYLTCEDCGFTEHFTTGPGYFYPSVCVKTLEEIRAGKKFPSLKKAADKYPNAHASVDTVLYVCPKCRTAEPCDQVMIWIPVDETGAWMSDLKRELPHTKYRLASFLVHRCPHCGTRMKIWKSGEIRCPKCGGKFSELQGDGCIWD